MAPKKKEAVAKAEKAARAVKKGVMKKVVKKRFSVTFHRPNTFKKEKAPLYARKRYVCADTEREREMSFLVCVCVFAERLRETYAYIDECDERKERRQ